MLCEGCGLTLRMQLSASIAVPVIDSEVRERGSLRLELEIWGVVWGGGMGRWYWHPQPLAHLFVARCE